MLWMNGSWFEKAFRWMRDVGWWRQGWSWMESSFHSCVERIFRSQDWNVSSRTGLAGELQIRCAVTRFMSTSSKRTVGTYFRVGSRPLEFWIFRFPVPARIINKIFLHGVHGEDSWCSKRNAGKIEPIRQESILSFEWQCWFLARERRTNRLEQNLVPQALLPDSIVCVCVYICIYIYVYRE
jgi:hypothetical protein